MMEISARRSRTLLGRLSLALPLLFVLAGESHAQFDQNIKLNNPATANDCVKIVDKTHVVSAGGPCGTASSVPYTGVTSVPTSSLLGRQTAGTGAAEAIAISANVNSILGAANYAAVRTLLALVIGTNVEAWDADLDSLAAVTPSANALTILAHTFAQIRTDLALVIGTNVEAWDADLDTLAGVTVTAAGTALLDDAAASNQRTTLGVDAAATTTTYTPALSFTTTLPTGLTYSVQRGRYTAFATGLVTFEAEITLSATGSGGAGQVLVSTPPFNSVATYTPACAVEWANIDITANYTQVSGRTLAADQFVGLRLSGDNQATATLTWAMLTATSQINVSCSYWK